MEKQIIRLIYCLSLTNYAVNSVVNASTDNLPFWSGQIRLAGLVIHPDGGSVPGIYPRKIDKQAYLLIAPGVVTGLSYHFNKNHSMKLQVALLKDCADLWEGYFHFGYRYTYPVNKKIDLRLSMGPTLLWREDWNRFQEWRDYDGYKFFNNSWKGYEYEFIMYGGELEVGYQVNEVKLIVGLTPGFMTLVTFGIEKRL